MGGLSVEANGSLLGLQNLLHHEDINRGVPDKHSLVTPISTPFLSLPLFSALPSASSSSSSSPTQLLSHLLHAPR